MGGRYVISGSQIGTIKALLENNKVGDVQKLIQEIYDDQFIGQSFNHMKDDLNELQKIDLTKKDGEEDVDNYMDWLNKRKQSIMNNVTDSFFRKILLEINTDYVEEYICLRK